MCAQVWVCALYRTLDLGSTFAFLLAFDYFGRFLCGITAPKLTELQDGRLALVFWIALGFSALAVFILLMMCCGKSPEFQAGKEEHEPRSTFFSRLWRSAKHTFAAPASGRLAFVVFAIFLAVSIVSSTFIPTYFTAYLKMSSTDASRLFAYGALLAAVWSFVLGAVLDSIGQMPLHLMVWSLVSVIAYGLVFFHSSVTKNAAANLPFLVPSLCGLQLGDVGTQ